MHNSNDEPLNLIKWGYRLIYVELFITCMVMMGYWHVPFTLPYFLGILALLFPLLFSKKELFAEEREVAETNTDAAGK